MGKYLAVASSSLKQNLAYRANSLIRIVSVLLSFAVLFYFWNSIYRQGSQIGNYSLSELITYYVFVAVFELVIIDGTAWSMGEEIKSGQLTGTVLKPIRYLEYKLSQSLGSLAYRLLLFVPAFAVVIYFMRTYLILPHDTILIVLAVCSALLAFLIYFLIYFIVGVISFWTADSFGFFFSAFVIIDFMQGGLLPLDLMPSWLTTIGNFMPFRFMFFVPVSVISGRIEWEYSFMVVPLLWIMVLYAIANWLYLKGLKKYEGYGI